MNRNGDSGFVEKPPHTDAARIRHLTPEAILAALGEPEADDPAGAVTTFLDRTILRPLPALEQRVAAFTPAEAEASRTAATAALTERRSFLDPGIGRSRLYGFHYLLWTNPLLEQYAVTGDAAWLRNWQDIFERWYECRDRVRGDWPGLDVIWYSLGVASRTPIFVDALDVGGDQLDRGTRVRLLGSILGGARWLREEHDSYRPGNWQFVAMCTLLRLAALYPRFTESAAWAETARQRIEEHLDRDVHPDGGHSERSPSYHRFCLRQLQQTVPYAEQYLGWRLGDHPRLAAMHEWVAAMATPSGWLPPFQDARHESAGPLLIAGHQFAGRPAHKAFVEATMTREEIEAELLRLPNRDSVSPLLSWHRLPSVDLPPTGRWLSGSRYFVSRIGDGVEVGYAAVNCGDHVPHELESHSHRARLDLVLWSHGIPVIWEAGGPSDYDDAAYHDWFQSARAHSTVVFPDREPDDAATTTVTTATSLESLDVLAGHHDAWGIRHHRLFLAVRGTDGLSGYWVIRDRVKGTGWRSLLHGRTSWRRTGHRAFASAGSPGVRLWCLGVKRWDSATGRTSYPGRDGPEWAELSTLELIPDATTLTMVVLPFASATVTPLSVEPRGDGCVVRWPNKTTDAISGDGWVRHDTEGATHVTWTGKATEPTVTVTLETTVAALEEGWFAV